MPVATNQVCVEVYSRQTDVLGEGPIWSTAEQALYWLDIVGKVLYRRAPSDDRSKSWPLPGYAGCLAELSPGVIGLAMGDGIQRLNLESGSLDLLASKPSGRAGTRFNDGKVDPLGRLWVGTMQNNIGPNGESIAINRSDGALYRFDADGTVGTIELDVGVPNTLAWSPDLKRFYFADSLRGAIYVYDFDADSGVAHNKRIFFESPDHGIPDGSAIDVDGCLWNARWDGGAVLRITPEGRLDQIIELPVPRPTSCIFGGQNLNILYVTSAAQGLSEQELRKSPLSGSVFAVTGAGQGMPVPPMALQPG